MSEQPTIVLIAGSWHNGSCYGRITKPLQDQYKLRCVTVTLPSTQGSPDVSFKDDIDAARAVISQEVDGGNDVVVIAHSFGGMVGNSAIKGFTKPRPLQTTPDRSDIRGHVIGLILIASGFTLTGVAFMDPAFGIPPPSWKVNSETGFAELIKPPRELFYHDLSREDADYWTSQLGTQSLKTLFEGGEHAYAGWLDVPVWYIGTIEDRGLPVFMQRMIVGTARAMGGNVEHRELRSSHSPFLSMPEECVRIVVEAVQAFTHKELRNLSTEARQQQIKQTQVEVPAIKLLAPGTWLRYGMPLGIGRVIGRCYAAFSWLRSWRLGTS